MISVKHHPRGILLSYDQHDRAMIRRIEDTVGGDRVLYSHGGVVIPPEAAPEILKLLGLNDVQWDVSVLSMAEHLAEHRNAQLGARLEVGQALIDPDLALNGSALLPYLDRHQAQAAAAIAIPLLRGIALFDEQGTGKTLSAIAGYECLRHRGQVAKLLVIAPKSVLSTWKSECELYLGGFRIAIMLGTRSQRHQAVRRQHDVLLTSYESALSEARLLRLTLAASPGRYMLVIDESYYIKNADTLRTQLVSEIRPYCERAVILCGTPTPNSARDIVSQVNIADGGVAFGGVSIPDNKVEAEQVIRSALANFVYLRRLKNDVLPGLPTKEIEKVHLELCPIQRSLYTSASDDLILAVKSVDDRDFARHLTSFISRRMALLQICSNPGGVDPLYDEEPAKLLVLDALLRELVEQQQKKVVIWSFFRHSLEAIAARFLRYGLVRVDGSVTNLDDRIGAIQRFQEDPGIHIFLGNAAAAGAGITLTAAHHAIYESFSNQAAHYMQSVDRIHRRGQTQKAVYHVLLAQHTIEESEFERLLLKEQAGQELLGDQYKEPMTRERFLEELTKDYAAGT